MKVFILNDTSYLGHHGCSRVMDNISAICRDNRVEIVGSVPVGRDWRRYPSVRKMMLCADLVIVNGEGTIHHGAVQGEWLLKAGDFLSHYDVPCALVNMTYQSNPDSWKQYLEKFSYVSVRESNSLKALEAIDIKCDLVPDLTFYRPELLSNSSRSGTGVGCSVVKEDSEALESLSRLNDFEFLPITYNTQSDSFQALLNDKLETFRASGFWGPFIRRMRSLVQRRVQTARIDIPLHTEYIRKLAQYERFLTGRFHCVCFCLQAETPFLCRSSNSFKIEGLLKDAGVSLERVLEKTTSFKEVQNSVKAYSTKELQNIRAYVGTSSPAIDRMFNNVFALARDGSCQKT